MDRELVGALGDLGLSTAEAETYVALLQACGQGPISAYGLARGMGRDPANLTKILNAMARRGSVRASGRRPRLFAPVDPEEFTGRLVSRFQERQLQALALLQDVGSAPPDQDLHALSSRREGLRVARRLIAGSRRVVLIDGAGDLLAELAEALTAAANDQGVMVLALGAGPAALPGVRTRPAGAARAWAATAPGPWLRLAVDGEACLEMLAHPAEADGLLHGHWSCRPAQAYLAHRSLAGELILADLLALLQAGVGGDLACRQAADQAALLQHQIAWRQRWREAGLPDYPADQAPADEVPADRASADQPGSQAEAAAERPQERAEQPEAAAAEENGPLQFIFRRRRS